MNKQQKIKMLEVINTSKYFKLKDLKDGSYSISCRDTDFWMSIRLNDIYAIASDKYTIKIETINQIIIFWRDTTNIHITTLPIFLYSKDGIKDIKDYYNLITVIKKRY